MRLPPLDRVPEQARGVGQRIGLAEREDEQPFALVRSACFRRCEQARRKAVAQADQASGDVGKAAAQMMGDIFEKDEGRLAFADDALDVRPEMAWIGSAQPFSRERERLAWIARKEDVHTSAPRAAVEGGNVVPDRRLIQDLIFHPRHENGRGVGVPLDITHSSILGTSNGEPEIEAARSGTEGEAKQACFSSSGNVSRGR